MKPMKAAPTGKRTEMSMVSSFWSAKEWLCGAKPLTCACAEPSACTWNCDDVAAVGNCGDGVGCNVGGEVEVLQEAPTPRILATVKFGIVAKAELYGYAVASA